MEQTNKIHALLIKHGFAEQLAAFATAQAAFETANFTSKVYRENNNAFGMKYAGQAIAQGEKNGHAVYLSVEDSVKDYVAYWKRRRMRMPLPIFFGSLQTWIEYLKKDIDPGPYFEADILQYYQGVKYYFEKLFT